MSRKAVLIFILGLVGFAVVSCDQRSKQLKAIDDIIESDPEAAYEALQSVDASRFSPDDSAYYALLYTQAQVKCHIPIHSDSLISKAYGRLINSRSDDLRKRVAFYKAQVAIDNNRLPAAMKDVLIAYDIAKARHDHYWIAKTAELIADIYFASYNYWQAEPYRMEAAREYLAAGKILNHRYALCDMGSIFMHIEKEREALTLFDSLYNVEEHDSFPNAALLKYIRRSTLPALRENDEFERLNEYLTNTIDTNNTALDKVDYALLRSDIYANENNISYATDILKSAIDIADEDIQKVWLKYSIYRKSLKNHDYETAALLSDTLLEIQNDLILKSLKESVIGIQRDYYSEINHIQEIKSERQRLLYSIILVFCGIIILSLIYNYRLKIQLQRIEIEQLISSLRMKNAQSEETDLVNDKLSQELQKKTSEIESLQNRLQKVKQSDNQNIIEELFKNKWKTLDLLCTEYYNLGDSHLTRKVILKNIEKELNSLKTRDNLFNIEESVNTYMDNIMEKLRKECPFLKEDDFVFLSLMYAGFSSRAVCYLTDIKYKNYYLKKSRIIKRIASSNAPDKENFILKMK